MTVKKDRINELIDELNKTGTSFVLTYADENNEVVFAANTSEEVATDMMIAALSELRFGEE